MPCSACQRQRQNNQPPPERVTASSNLNDQSRNLEGDTNRSSDAGANDAYATSASVDATSSRMATAGSNAGLSGESMATDPSAGLDASLNSFVDSKDFDEMKALSGDAEKAMMGFITELNDKNFENTIRSNVAFIKFFSPGCGHCMRLAPVWENLAAKADGANVKIAEVDCSRFGKLCDSQGVDGYPSLLLYKGGKKVGEYNGKRTVPEMLAYLQKHSS